VGRAEPFTSLGQLVERFATDRPDDPALRAGGRCFSRAEIAATAKTLGAGWSALGFRPGDVVAVVGEGGTSLAHALFSAGAAGLVSLMVDPRLTADEARTVYERARPRALAVCDRASVPLESNLPRFDFDAGGCARLREAAFAPDSGQGAAAIVDPAAPAVMLVTSGTSGATRVVALSAGNLSANIVAGSEAHPCQRADVFLSLLPATHAFELTTGLLGPLCCGASVVFPGSRNPNRLLALVASERVTCVNVVPAILGMMAVELREAEGGREALAALRDRLRAITCGGAPVAPELAALLVRHHLPLWLGYGLTEAAPIVAVGEAAKLPPGSTGRPLPGVEVRIESDSGEILVRGANVMSGYVGDDEATAAALHDGWLRTGDLGRLDGEDNLFITGRRRELIVTGAGLKLSPEEIERAYGSSLFAEVCAVGVPDVVGGGGERPHLAVVPSPDGTHDAAALGEEFRRLSAAAGDRRALTMTVLGAAMPRTRTLKLRRDLVRRLVLERLGGRA